MGNDQPNRAIKNSPVKYISSIVAGYTHKQVFLIAIHSRACMNNKLIYI